MQFLLGRSGIQLHLHASSAAALSIHTHLRQIKLYYNLFLFFSFLFFSFNRHIHFQIIYIHLFYCRHSLRLHINPKPSQLARVGTTPLSLSLSPCVRVCVLRVFPPFCSLKYPKYLLTSRRQLPLRCHKIKGYSQPLAHECDIYIYIYTAAYAPVCFEEKQLKERRRDQRS